IKVGGTNQQFVYEAKIPIGNNSLAQFPINIFPNEKVEIEIKTGEIDMSEMRGEGMVNGSGMSGGGPGGGGMRGGGKGGRAGGGSTFMEKLSLDIDLKLAK
ncbi:MAG: hypothetical protein GXO85_07175, partial [Chlorobi bacterium]|nr:hypothetical protein [Chlorobiota bacterium]